MMRLCVRACNGGPRVAVMVGVAGLAASRFTFAQVCMWDRFAGGDMPGGGEVRTMAVFDDGSGPGLFIGGHAIMRAGHLTGVNGIARWDGHDWRRLQAGSTIGVTGSVHAMAVFDDGGGPGLYVGGSGLSVPSVQSPNLIRWTGTAWAGVGGGLTGGAVMALTTFDDGSGPALYAGGDFTAAGVTPAARIARWNGASWSALGGGVPSGQVRALAWYDDGSGPALYAGGSFPSAGGAPASNVARWRGGGWEPVGTGFNNLVAALLPHDDGGGAALYAGGAFNSANGPSWVARWRGAGAWEAIPGGPTSQVYAFQSHNEVGASSLYAAGSFSGVNGQSAGRLARWDGQAWSPAGTGVNNNWVNALAVFDEGNGPRIFAGGNFFGGSGPERIAKYAGGDLRVPGSGFDDTAGSLAVFDDGTGPALYASGAFTRAGDASGRLVKRVGDAWIDVPGVAANGVFPFVRALTAFDDGSGPRLFAGGQFVRFGTGSGCLAVFDGQSWSSVGGGVSNGLVEGEVWAVHPHDEGSGPVLYVAGSFALAGGSSANNIARWDGQAWSPLGFGLNGRVWALETYDDGAGPKLFAGGEFGIAGTVSAPRIARWDGAAWSAITTSAIQGTVRTMEVHDDGTGPQLYIGGQFAAVQGIPNTSKLARWNGQTWSAVGMGISIGGTGTAGFVSTLVSIDQPAGPMLYAGGNFQNGTARYLTRWDGSVWTTAGEPDAAVSVMLREEMPGGNRLHVAGSFMEIAGGSARRMATLACQPATCYANCDASTAAPILNVADFTCFLQRFAAGGSYANCDQSTAAPVLNVADFTCFLQRFATGCP